jgi:hypothetical protein
MSLTGTAFQLLTVALTAVLAVAVVLVWNRMPGPKAIRLASRVTLLITAYAAAAIAVLVSVNIGYGDLIGSWSALFNNVQAPASNWHYQHGHRHPAQWHLPPQENHFPGE